MISLRAFERNCTTTVNWNDDVFNEECYNSYLAKLMADINVKKIVKLIDGEEVEVLKESE